MTKSLVNSDDPNQRYGFVIHDVARLYRRYFERLAQPLGLSRAQYAVLAYLLRFDGARQHELAEALDIQPITLARLVDRLEEKAWVLRKADANDRRAKRVFIQDKARPVLEKMWDFGLIVRAESFKNIPEKDQEEFLRVLIQIRSNLSRKVAEN